MQYISEYLTPDQHDWLLAKIDQQPWLNKLKRRVQHYGYQYNYKNRSIGASSFIGSLPEWVNSLIMELSSKKIITQIPNQLIVNEYEPGQGIAPHIDCIPCFGETVLSLSLASSCVINFISTRTGQQIALFLEPRSLLVLSGEARYEWKHGIAPRKTDTYQGQVFKRERRVSLTFRKVII